MSDQYGISFIEEKCIQCHGCEIACKSWRNVELGVKWRHVDAIWHGRYPDIKISSVSVACMHCSNPVCVDVCPEGAIQKREEDGVVVIDQEKCTGCRLCLEECPFKVPQFGMDGKVQKCDLCLHEIDFNAECPPCVATCPTQALLFGKMDQREKRAKEQSLMKSIELMKIS